jgi:hypothetical protein
MLIFSGFGMLVPLYWILGLILGKTLDLSPYFPAPAPGLIYLALICLAIWFTGKKLNSKVAKVLIDPETGGEVEFKPNHSLFFIKIEYWAFLSLGFAWPLIMM